MSSQVSEFCPRSGKPHNASSSSLFCPSCGQALTPQTPVRGEKKIDIIDLSDSPDTTKATYIPAAQNYIRTTAEAARQTSI